MATLTSEPDNGRKSTRGRRLKFEILITFITLAVLTAVGIHEAKPILKKRVVALLSEKFQGDVQLGDLEVSVYPKVQAHGSNLSVRYGNRSDVSPLIQVREFTGQASLLSLFEKPWKIDQVELHGLVIQIPPKDP